MTAIFQKVVAGIALLLITPFITRSCNSQERLLCEQREKIVQEVLTLLPEITNIIQYEVGIPEICYVPNNEGLLPDTPPEQIQAYNGYRKNVDLLNDKMRSIPHNQDTLAALQTFYDAVGTFERKCGERDDEYRQLFRNLTDTKGHLVEKLILSREQCFR